MNRQIFDEMIGESRPSTVDIDAIFARRRRSDRRRRLAGAGMAGLLAVGLATGAVAYVGHGAPGGSTSGPGTAKVGTAASPTPWPPDIVATIERELRDVVTRVAPGARLSGVARSDQWGRFDSATSPKCNTAPSKDGRPACDFFDYETYGMTATVTLGNRRGSLVIALIHRLDGRDGRSRWGCKDGYRDSVCRETTTPEGRWLLTNSQRNPAEFDPNPSISYQIATDRGNGVGVWVDHKNNVNNGPNSDASPLTLAQLTQIALDPALVPEP